MFNSEIRELTYILKLHRFHVINDAVSFTKPKWNEIEI